MEIISLIGFTVRHHGNYDSTVLYILITFTRTCIHVYIYIPVTLKELTTWAAHTCNSCACPAIFDTETESKGFSAMLMAGRENLPLCKVSQSNLVRLVSNACRIIHVGEEGKILKKMKNFFFSLTPLTITNFDHVFYGLFNLLDHRLTPH